MPVLLALVHTLIRSIWRPQDVRFKRRYVGACSMLLVACQEAGEFDRRISAFTLLRAVGNLCIPGPGYDRDDAKQMVTHLEAGCRTLKTGDS